VSIDAGGGQTLGEVEASTADCRRRAESLCRASEEALAVARVMLELSAGEFLLVKALMGGKSMAEVAREAGQTRAAVSHQVKMLVMKYPVFGFLRGGRKGGLDK